MPKRFGDYICNKVKSDLTQDLDESEGAQHTLELDMAGNSASSSLAATLGYLRRDVQLLVQKQEKNKVDLWMDMEARWKELLEQDITKGLNMEVSEEELLGTPTACKIAASSVVASVTIKEAEMFCKINTGDKKYLDIRSEVCKEIARQQGCTQTICWLARQPKLLNHLFAREWIWSGNILVKKRTRNI